MTAAIQKEVMTLPNNAALSRGIRVKLSGGYLAAAGIGEDCIGVMEKPTFAADPVGAVRPITGVDTLCMVAAGAITQYAEVYEAASGKISATVTGKRLGIALEAASGDGSLIEVLPLGDSSANGVVSEERYFTEENGKTSHTGSVVVPAGASILEIMVQNVVLWNDGTSATLKVGDGTDDDGFYTGVNLKATDLTAGQTLTFAKTGGKEGAYFSGSATHIDGLYSASARTISGIVTAAGGNGTAGRTRLVVTYALPNSVAATAAA